MIRRFARWSVLVMGVLSLGTAAQAQSEKAAFTATVTVDSADLREKPSKDGAIVDNAFKGARLPAFGLSGDKLWVSVKGPDGRAWVSRSQVSVTKGAPSDAPSGIEPTTTAVAATPTPKPSTTAVVARPTPTPASPSGGVNGPAKYAYVVVPKTNVLLNANDGSPTLAVASRNDVFETSGFSRDKNYVRVRTSDGRIGWVAKNDMKPGKPETEVAHADRPTSHVPDDGFHDDFVPVGPPARHRPVRNVSASDDTRIWAEGGTLLFNEKVTSNEGYGYQLNGKGFGVGLRFDHKLVSGLSIDGGFLGMDDSRLPIPGSTTSLFATTFRIDASAKYTYRFGDDENPPEIFGLAGFQNYSFYVQPQSNAFYYSQIYNGGAVGLGGAYGFGQFKIGADYRYLVPILPGERYGSGGAGGDGQSSASNGASLGLGISYLFSNGGGLGLNYRYHQYVTNWNGTGVRYVNIVGTATQENLTGVQVIDTFQTITLQYERGF